MDTERNVSCLSCKNFTAQLGPDGYCKFYRHNVTRPDVICNMYEESTDDSNDAEPAVLLDSLQAQKPVTVSKEQQKRIFNNIIHNLGTTGAFIISMIFLFTGVITSSELFRFYDLDMGVKLLASALILIFVILFMAFLFWIVSKFKAMSIIILSISIALLTVIVINYNSLWYELHNLVMLIISIFIPNSIY